MIDFLAKQIIKHPALTDLTPLPWLLSRKTKDFLTGINLWALKQSQYWSEENLAGLQFYRLKKTISQAYENVPFWKKFFSRNNIKPGDIRTFDDFKKIPITTRDTLSQAAVKELIRESVQPEDLRFRTTTSGSTGHPLEIFYDRYLVFIREIATNAREFDFFGLNFKKFNYIFMNLPVHWRQDHGPLINLPRGLEELEKRKEEIYRTIKDNSPPILFGVTSVIVRLARLAAEDKVDLDIRGAFCRTEKLWPVDRKLIEETFHCPVSNSYGMRESKHAAHECRYHNGFHINSEYMYVEVTDENGRSLPDNAEGRILITVFDNKTMPFIRYDSGDLGKITREPCPCGLTLPRLFVEGRSNHFFEMPDEKKVPLKIILQKIQFTPYYLKMKQFQFVQDKIDKIRLLIVPHKIFSKTDELGLKMLIDELFGSKVKLDFEYTDKIEQKGNKITSFIKNI
ncbi:hypothetical protein A2833_02215 [Candidatus Azambacteria bacterium RIFCSPHIGHO2_01_FULL_44_55]|uniref:Uncharacterized protein n=1 Tax=Candidatus Azambacteria bacterium RIFCSPLOWO2_02_FULL_44_14 TaxID=1797306 RepID=A0A1F5CCP0_9BACT|nr:MAG: hypothetical protein A3A18_01585 [Candidatus Azambacteria bacterium RIFCSPLOWO2_01_FULL_44_84]OGD32970.1 MAG: hypothetical protein A3C78_00370 [Candidatus Azambacteria bacterium RIFCSPHIGHO2_02_FULL_45_18]OGD40414.1 MAG: hypothetical protein A2833_02215 [Candidatus Azambacteria bacterium RIFCSPHIGHO2_01_FULL_44_55]OGD40626.1 MAG: hypothetical protein A3I30_01235 [Candidatus Azambacteria bacterium RIFCSPLOWO2_02_FULL_44_14]OGD52315.1 MAG: hypothetical protein A2608_00185 [Candidatus Azam